MIFSSGLENSNFSQILVGCSELYPLVYLPQKYINPLNNYENAGTPMCQINVHARKDKNTASERFSSHSDFFFGSFPMQYLIRFVL